jgi:hypothetical protein
MIFSLSFRQIRVDVAKVDIRRRTSGVLAFDAGDVLRNYRDSEVSLSALPQTLHRRSTIMFYVKRYPTNALKCEKAGIFMNSRFISSCRFEQLCIPISSFDDPRLHGDARWPFTGRGCGCAQLLPVAIVEATLPPCRKMTSW